jgi:fatty-acid desaturase
MVLFHLGAIAALFMFNWQVFAAAVVLYWLATGLGISMGYHRLLTHRSYKVPLLLEYFFAVSGTLAARGAIKSIQDGQRCAGTRAEK